MEVVEIKILLKNKQAVIPKYVTEGSACFDLTATEIEYNRSDGLTVVKFGFSTEIPKGYKVVLKPRSNLTEFKWILQNSPVQIDSDYRGEWMLNFRRLYFKTPFPYEVGERVAQGFIERVIRTSFKSVNHLEISARGSVGFSSTGK